MNILKKYWDSVHVYILLLIPFTCICAGIFWTFFKLLGYYPHLSWIKIGLFDFSQIIYLGIAIYFILQNKKDSSYISSHIFYIKCYTSIALFIQYIFILILFPSDYIWECTFLFFAASVFFFDSKMMVFHVVCYTAFLLMAHILNPDAYLPLNEPNYIEIIAFRLLVLSLTILFILLIVYFAEHFIIRALANEKENIHLLEKQVEYYKNTDLMDMELRKFRHDIKNHFICLEQLLNDGNMEEFNTYFKDLEKSFSSQKKIYFSGNEIIDAILNYDISRYCSEFVKITIFGALTEIRTVSSMDLCTLFSNILSNAISAANECNAEGKPELTIRFQSGRRYFSIEISNSISKNEQIKFYKKMKYNMDKNHRLGLNKIKEVTQKYNGSFEQYIKGQTLTTGIYLPL
ncbi:MAG: GHKL domain-containing protein [Roseburia sp.]|nr:GHKL domain-containing protein [Roseburia sp.]MCM1279242.1 GHKL domain-containing protein [Robinsoniella sp.]